MTSFTPGANTFLDVGLGLISPHKPYSFGEIELWEGAKVLEYLRIYGITETMALLRGSGTSDLVEFILANHGFSGKLQMKIESKARNILYRRSRTTPSPAPVSP